MRKLVFTALIAALAMPVAAQAQDRGELRRDRQDIRHETRELHDAYRSGDRREIRRQRDDVRGARQEYREDLRDRDRRYGRDDWRGWRDTNGRAFAGGNWQAPFRYNQFRPGLRIDRGYYAPRYTISDPWRYHLPAAGSNRRWVRHYNDMLLVDARRGVVVQVIRGFYR